MKFRNFVAVFLVIIFGISEMNAQSYELGKVTVAELKEKENPKDTTAPATILFKKAKTILCSPIATSLN